ncbi:MAG: hypothetical protein ACP5G0_08290 [Desulfomonilia bacterium]
MAKAKIYPLYEKRIQHKIIALIEDMEKNYLENENTHNRDSDRNITILGEYLLRMTRIIIDECNDNEEIKRIIPKYLPEEFTLAGILDSDEKKNSP